MTGAGSTLYPLGGGGLVTPLAHVLLWTTTFPHQIFRALGHALADYYFFALEPRGPGARGPRESPVPPPGYTVLPAQGPLSSVMDYYICGAEGAAGKKIGVLDTGDKRNMWI